MSSDCSFKTCSHVRWSYIPPCSNHSKTFVNICKKSNELKMSLVMINHLTSRHMLRLCPAARTKQFPTFKRKQLEEVFNLEVDVQAPYNIAINGKSYISQRRRLTFQAADMPARTKHAIISSMQVYSSDAPIAVRQWSSRGHSNKDQCWWGFRQWNALNLAHQFVTKPCGFATLYVKVPPQMTHRLGFR